MGQFTEIKRRLKAGLNETITVSGSFLYVTKLDKRVRIELYSRENAEKSEVIMEEGMTWAEDPNILNRFTAINIVSETDQDIVFLAGFGRVTNESLTIRTTQDTPLNVIVTNTFNNVIPVKSYNDPNIIGMTKVSSSFRINKELFRLKKSLSPAKEFIFLTGLSFDFWVGPYGVSSTLYPPNHTEKIYVPKNVLAFIMFKGYNYDVEDLISVTYYEKSL